MARRRMQGRRNFGPRKERDWEGLISTGALVNVAAGVLTSNVIYVPTEVDTIVRIIGEVVVVPQAGDSVTYAGIYLNQAGAAKDPGLVGDIGQNVWMWWRPMLASLVAGASNRGQFFVDIKTSRKLHSSDNTLHCCVQCPVAYSYSMTLRGLILSS